MRHGKRIIDHGRYQLDFRNEKVRDYATKVIDRVVSDYGVGYIKMDYNIDAGLGTEIDADSFGDGLLEHNRAYLDWIRSIKQKYPDLILENCASGGMRMDYAMLGEMHIQSTSDQTNYGPMAVIAANSSIAVLPEQAAMWSYPLSTGDDNEAAYNMINSMLIRVHLSGDVANLTEKQFSDVKEGIKVYKEIRNHIPDFLPFYPLGLNTYQKPFAAIGYKTKDKRYLAVWKMDTKEQSIEIPLENPKNAKLLYPLDTDARLQINDNGITLNMPSKFSAVLIEI
jgi:alpha-galactosidase